jgi:ataxia telangiectasia mutated family protein
VDSIIEEYEGKVIRDFLLYAKLPSFQQKPNAGRSASTTDSQAASFTDLQLVAPRGRERKISAFFLKSLESLISEWEFLQDNVTAEMSRRTLDLAITAITFETLLMFNGTVSNRQVLQRAAKVISTVTPLLNENRWTAAEKSLVVSPLESIVHHAGHSHGKRIWETLSWPGTKSGIQEKILSSLTPDGTSCQGACSTRRISFLRLIWQNAEVNHHMLFNPTH